MQSDFVSVQQVLDFLITKLAAQAPCVSTNIVFLATEKLLLPSGSLVRDETFRKYFLFKITLKIMTGENTLISFYGSIKSLASITSL